MKLFDINIETLMKIIDSCVGVVWLTTTEGDKINLKSKLSQLIGLAKILGTEEIEVADITCEDPQDGARIFGYLFYGRH